MGGISVHAIPNEPRAVPVRNDKVTDGGNDKVVRSLRHGWPADDVPFARIRAGLPVAMKDGERRIVYRLRHHVESLGPNDFFSTMQEKMQQKAEEPANESEQF